MIHRVEYILKHNRIVQKTYIIVFSLIFRFIGLFIKPNPKQVLFQSLIGKNFGDSPKVLFDAMKKNDFFKSYSFIWAFDNPEKFEVDGAKKVKLNRLSYYLVALKSGVWITNVSIERGLRFKPKKTIYINTNHGIPIKYCGNAQKNRKDYDFSKVDFMCYSSEFEKKVYVRDYKILPENLYCCGMPRNDELYKFKTVNRDKIKERLGLPKDKKIILYAPTWRDSTDKGKNYNNVPPISVDYLKSKLGNEYIFLLRMHHLTTEMLNTKYDDFFINVSDVSSINDILFVTDILVSDYSATIFDFAILEKPILAFAYDYEEYSRTRGIYQDLEEIIPGNVCTTQEELIEHIQIIDYQKECEKSRKIKNDYLDVPGNATKVCIDYLISKISEEK